jgi:hypothetical protein
MIYSATGTRSFDAKKHGNILFQCMLELSLPTHFISGACPGLDAIFCETALALYPDAKHTVLVPGTPVRGIEWIIPNDPRVEVIYLPSNTTTKYRNRELVKRADWVLAFPKYEQHRQPYSGTWQTVRMAQQANKLLRCYTLEPRSCSGITENLAKLFKTTLSL